MFIITLLLLATSCSTPSKTENNIYGNWGLTKTELYVDDKLNGTLTPSEITTYYLFNHCQPNENCSLQIQEDGEVEHLNYIYLKDTNRLIIDNETYTVEYLNQTELTIKKTYEPYSSLYTFRKVE